MSLSLLALAGAAAFLCDAPSHHDGDNVRCANMDQTIRLQGIDAPEMPGSCRPGRNCTPGDPYAARDYLRNLTRGRALNCDAQDVDRYGRIIARCRVQDVDLSCAMIASGLAAPRYAALDCGTSPVPAPTTAELPELPPPLPDVSPERRPPVAAPDMAPARTRADDIAAMVSPLWLGLAGFALVNLVTFLLFAIDKRRATAGRSRHRIAERTLLAWAALGGSPAAWQAIRALRHKSSKDSFKLRLLLITGVQIGAMIGGLWWWLDG
jgi:uncharacterized membrane protein YsdA (DUF1294 family)